MNNDSALKVPVVLVATLMNLVRMEFGSSVSLSRFLFETHAFEPSDLVSFPAICLGTCRECLHLICETEQISLPIAT